MISYSQTRFSLATDVALQRSFKEGQQFWAVGHSVVGHWHFSSNSGVYASVSYYSPGSFKNRLIATAKSPSTSPQTISFFNHAELRLKQVSIGWKRYLKGSYESDKWNLYGLAGFGLVWGKAINTYSETIDTVLYNLPEKPVTGTGRFKRLTLDLGLGWELEVGDEIYVYAEGKAWIPTTDYPSKYLFVSEKSPLVGTVGAGIRVLF